MSTRLSFRPRPLDLNKPLTIVRDINELDAADGLVSRDITHQHEALDKDNEEVWLDPAYSIQLLEYTRRPNFRQMRIVNMYES